MLQSDCRCAYWPISCRSIGEIFTLAFGLFFTYVRSINFFAKIPGFGTDDHSRFVVFLPSPLPHLKCGWTLYQFHLCILLGGLSTIVASYLARARGSNEPELSITRVNDLEQFIRECRAFQMDFGVEWMCKGVVRNMDE